MKELKRENFLGDYIKGQFIQSKQPDGNFKDISPADRNDEVLEVEYKYEHVDEACVAAKEAFKSWSALSIEERKVYMMRLKELYISNVDRVAEAIARDTGKPLWESMTEAKALAGKIDITYSASLNLIKEQLVENALPGVPGYVRFKPRGVMSVIGPFNFPAHLPNGHIVPALATGNTVVFKPSEQTPYVGQIMAEIFNQAEFPPGVFNLVQGSAETGRRLVKNEFVDGILFTGSYEVGLKIKQDTLSHYWKILALEMGGKNTAIVWEDADLDKAVYENLVGAFITSGQRCSCTSRIILHEKIADEFTERFYKAAKKLTIGYWQDNPFMGPIINEQAVEKYVRFQEIAKREGCENLMRGKPLELKQAGHYVTPSIHLVSEFDEKSVYQNNEIFGPNVALYRETNFEHCFDIINSSGYGLVASVFSKNKANYEYALQNANVGLLNWNRTTNGASSRLPFGGMGKSGNNRPTAHYAVYYCTEPIASLEDETPFDPSKTLPGIDLS